MRIPFLLDFELFDFSNFLHSHFFNLVLGFNGLLLLLMLHLLAKAFLFGPLVVHPSDLGLQVRFVFSHDLLDFEGLRSGCMNLFQCSLLFFLKHADPILQLPDIVLNIDSDGASLLVTQFLGLQVDHHTRLLPLNILRPVGLR